MFKIELSNIIDQFKNIQKTNFLDVLADKTSITRPAMQLNLHIVTTIKHNDQFFNETHKLSVLVSGFHSWHNSGDKSSLADWKYIAKESKFSLMHAIDSLHNNYCFSLIETIDPTHSAYVPTDVIVTCEFADTGIIPVTIVHSHLETNCTLIEITAC